MPTSLGSPSRLAQERLLRASYFVESWTTIDVAAIVVLISCCEFGRLSEFLVYKSHFAEACTMLRDVAQTECMTVELEALRPLGVLAVAGFLNIVVPKAPLPHPSNFLALSHRHS